MLNVSFIHSFLPWTIRYISFDVCIFPSVLCEWLHSKINSWEEMKSLTTLPLLLLLLTSRISSVLAALSTFVPLTCNADLASCLNSSAETTLSSLINNAGIGHEIIIPCGTCVYVDYDDGSTITLSGGINIIGSLRFPSHADVTIRTTKVIVQGLLTIEPPILGHRVGFRMYEEDGKHDVVYVNPVGENAAQCDGYGCDVGRMPIAVLGGE